MVTVSTQAQIALRSLLPLDRDRVERHLRLLERFPHDEHVRQLVRRLPAEQAGDDGDVYLMRVTPAIRLLFRDRGGDVEVLDVVTHERLERMYG